LVFCQPSSFSIGNTKHLKKKMVGPEGLEPPVCRL
jgi:hypothetical protein